MRVVNTLGVLVLGILIGSGVSVAPAPAFGEAASVSLEARVRQLEDRAEIERLLMEYGRALDGRDFVAYSHLFASDGEWSGGLGTFRGPAAIQAAMEKAFKVATGAPAPAPNFHLLTNAIIDIQGDHAQALSKWTFVRVMDNKPVIALAGHYDDTLVREAGHWRFLRRLAPAVLEPAPKPSS